MTQYLQLEDVLRQIRRAGFWVGDPGLLAAALARPQASAFGADSYPSLWQKAAALCQSIDSAQSLADGNKRLAWLVTKVFLAMNGQRLTASADEGERFMLDQVASHASLEEIAAWLRSHCHDAPPPDLPETESGP
ncbi:MAG: Fic family protein [Actinomycetota bacterium]|nr:Fic family protein [Actinomycetota bacterium]